MAVDDYLFRETDSLVLPLKTLYPLSIPVAHYQLRHYISCEGEDVLYYASGAELFSLNTSTQKRTHIATLPFDTRCTASGHGWLCCGGEDEGHFAAVKLTGGSSLAADVDALLPLDLGNRPLGRPATSTPTVKLERIGEEIVNSISIHKLASAEEGGEDEVVAVLTNNDKTVRVYCLTHGLEEAVLDLPFPMNHASISPDGNLMVAVGDYHQAFFFERSGSRQRTQSTKTDTAAGGGHSEWTKISVAMLHIPANSSTTGYFTTAWSPSGKLCAVGSECGYISVFDTDLLRASEFGEDAIVQVIRSTRPDTSHGPGAVRTMCFSPQPWDLLIWAEDQARVCVADLREGLLARQVLSLDPKEDSVIKIDTQLIDVEDASESSNNERNREIARLESELNQEQDLINRHRRALASAANDTSAALEVVGEFMSAVLQRRRHAGVVESDNDPHGLTAQERSILDALRTREHRDIVQRERERIASIPRSINYPSTTGESREQRAELSSDSFPSLTRNRSSEGRNIALPSLGSLRDFLRDRSERERESGSTSDDANRSSSNTGPEPPAAARPSNANTTSAPRSMDPLIEMGRLRQLARARERVRNMQTASRGFDDYGVIGRRVGMSGRFNPAFGVRTAGLAMSEDGRKLYVGTEEGIFEFEIDVRGRKGWGAVQPR
ncbi:WD domain containing protein [Lasiodiplodia theobromae]|uniref:WD domain containing protein n=1 Tax=Lasiodiplodia theobromae TaxID=45133 RepID=UPI0015C3AF16|nr:WD domain containing protein [Lasiodiplodia theobromae]KAF4541100.1 WD domain containing protein [Lasiodiplodia theobromae]